MSTLAANSWHYASEEVCQELKNDPLSLLAGGENVKSNTVRQVFRSGDYYIKLDRRANKSFCGEFNSARLCAAENIPAVEHLAWGRSAEGSWLVTRAADGFVESASLFKYRQNFEVYERAAEFLKKIFDSKIYHPDLHMGNVLTDTAGKCFCLVDLHGVRKRNFFDRFRIYMMHRAVMEFRNTLSDSEMLHLIDLCGIRNPESFFRKALAREAGFLRNVTPKRRRQILNGYFKYTRIESDGRIVDIEAEEKELARCEMIVSPDAGELFLFHFFLTQAKIPHRRILAFDPAGGSCLIEEELPEKYRSRSGGAELSCRLEYNGVSSSESDFCNGYLHDIAGVFRENR